MDANERESGKPEEEDPIRAFVLQNEARGEARPKRGGGWVVPFLASVLVTGLILAAVYYFWGQ